MCFVFPWDVISCLMMGMAKFSLLTLTQKYQQQQQGQHFKDVEVTILMLGAFRINFVLIRHRHH